MLRVSYRVLRSTSLTRRFVPSPWVHVRSMCTSKDIKKEAGPVIPPVPEKDGEMALPPATKELDEAARKEIKGMEEEILAKSVKPHIRKRTSPWLLGGAMAIGLLYYMKYRYKTGSFRIASRVISHNLDIYYFFLLNPNLLDKHFLLKPPQYPHYTVVIDFKDLTILTKNEEGETVPSMRPYMDVFLEELSKCCEVVIWSSLDDPNIPEWMENLEKTSPCFHSAFGFSDCTIQSGLVIKDIGRLNRPLENIIQITSNPSHGLRQPENMLLIRPWDGGEDDATLLSIFVFLQYVTQNHNPATSDVRPLLKPFQTRDPSILYSDTANKFKEQILATNVETKAQLELMKKEQRPGMPGQQMNFQSLLVE